MYQRRMNRQSAADVGIGGGGLIDLVFILLVALALAVRADKSRDAVTQIKEEDIAHAKENPETGVEVLVTRDGKFLVEGQQVAEGAVLDAVKSKISDQRRHVNWLVHPEAKNGPVSRGYLILSDKFPMNWIVE